MMFGIIRRSLFNLNRIMWAINVVWKRFYLNCGPCCFFDMTLFDDHLCQNFSLLSYIIKNLTVLLKGNKDSNEFAILHQQENWFMKSIFLFIWNILIVLYFVRYRIYRIRCLIHCICNLKWFHKNRSNHFAPYQEK